MTQNDLEASEIILNIKLSECYSKKQMAALIEMGKSKIQLPFAKKKAYVEELHKLITSEKAKSYNG